MGPSHRTQGLVPATQGAAFHCAKVPCCIPWAYLLGYPAELCPHPRVEGPHQSWNGSGSTRLNRQANVANDGTRDVNQETTGTTRPARAKDAEENMFLVPKVASPF